MSHFSVPLRDIQFLTEQVFKFPAHYQQQYPELGLDADTLTAIIQEGARFAEQTLAPLNAVGDAQGCRLENGCVVTPAGFKEAYQAYIAGGWPALSHSPKWGGQGLPQSLGFILDELMGTANWAWAMYPGLSHGGMHTLEMHGSEEQQATYLPKLISGQWTATMCLTEAHCGTDLGLLKTRATPAADGSYCLNGSKIFISAGEHDLAENIIHIVLARLPEAPAGVKGLSLFIVPKYLPSEDGECGVRNGVSCGRLEEKMGIHGNATCLLNFDNATGFLLGPANQGLACMFTFMNFARIGTAIQGLAHTEWGYQNSLAYARERRQMRALNGAAEPQQPADTLMVHPDIRRMLLTQKAFAEGGRALIYFTAQQADLLDSEDPAARQRAESLLSVLTPIAKAFLTERSFECASDALQILGGHGYIREWGLEQNLRDSRIGLLYEGTTQIQALDLLGRKVLMNRAKNIQPLWLMIRAELENQHSPQLQPLAAKLAQLLEDWQSLTRMLGMKALKNRDEVGAASVDYLHFSGYVVLAWLWLRMANVAQQAGGDLAASKLASAEFYYARLLPRAHMHQAAMESGADNLTALAAEMFDSARGGV